MIKIRIKSKITEAVDKNMLTAVQEHNVNLIINIIKKHTSDKKELEEATSYYKRLVGGIKPLKTKRISKFITAQSFSKIFKLEDSRILKIFSESAGDAARDYDAFVKMHKDHKAGRANDSALIIYDVGTFDDVYWVEMEELIPFNKYLEESGRIKKNRDEEKLDYEIIHMARFFESEKNTIEDLIQYLKEHGDIMADSGWEEKDNTELLLYNTLTNNSKSKFKSIMTKEEILALFNCLKQTPRNIIQYNDEIASRNIGLRSEPLKSGKMIFIVFDF